MEPDAYHEPVLLREMIDAINIRGDGTYVDCTFGGGGHAREILARLDQNGRLVAFDQDATAAANAPNDARVTFVHHNFRHLQRFLRLQKITAADGIIADLGVSSYQFDQGLRGFSTRFEGPMDMRMDTRQELKASDILRNYSAGQLHKMFEQYGEVTNAITLAKKIVELRTTVSFDTTANFKAALQTTVKGNPNRYFAQVFQALRIEVNDEMGSLKEMLQQAPAVLKSGARIAVITFHSIEDRLVKNFFRKGHFDEKEEEYNVFGQPKNVAPLKVITKKPVTPSPGEIERNPRARSAKLRVAEKI